MAEVANVLPVMITPHMDCRRQLALFSSCHRVSHNSEFLARKICSGKVASNIPDMSAVSEESCKAETINE